ncbi:hypothetical protein IW148_004812 [Coemansia sp. RSA 1199]|nr:hypothetical protein IW148_004812 [Coemansia sp. RSA 1199]
MFVYFFFIFLNVYHAIRFACTIIESPNPSFTFESATTERTTANDGLYTASNAVTEKTEATPTAVNNTNEPGFKVEKATAANDELCTANNTIVEKTDATPTTENIAEEPGFKAKKSSVTQNHNMHSHKAVPPLVPKRKPLIRVKGRMYGNTNDEFQRYDNPAGYYNKFTYNPDGGPKRRGELVANYYGFAAF